MGGVPRAVLMRPRAVHILVAMCYRLVGTGVKNWTPEDWQLAERLLGMAWLNREEPEWGFASLIDKESITL